MGNRPALIEHLKAERFGELKAKLKKCASQAEQNQILSAIETKRLEEFMAWLQADGACTAALYGVITGLLLNLTDLQRRAELFRPDD